MKFLLLVSCLAVSAALAQAQTGGSYSLGWNTLAGGGQTFATGGPYRLGGSAGQPDAGFLGGGDYVLQGGFWSPASAPVLDAPPSTPVPLAFAFRSATPNPFRDMTTLRFELPSVAPVDLTLHAVDGRLVRRLLRGERAAGRHQAVWNGRDDQGRPVPSGVYFVRLRAGADVATQRLVHLD